MLRSTTPSLHQWPIRTVQSDAGPPATGVARRGCDRGGHGVLVRLLPSQQASLDAARENSLAAIRDGARKNNGIAIGEEVASRLLEIHDGVIPTVAYTPGLGPAVWQPTPPAFANALLPGFAQVTPFALASASQFRPGPPPALSSLMWARDYNEVKSFGVATGSLRTPEQTDIGVSTPSTQSRSTAGRSGGTRSRTVSMFADRSLLCDGKHRDPRLSDSVLGRQIPLQLLATGDGDSGRGHRWESGHGTRCFMDRACHYPCASLNIPRHTDVGRARRPGLSNSSMARTWFISSSIAR
jgi:hypothetical protein